MPTTLFERKIAIFDFRVLFGFANSEGALNQKRLDVGSGTGDTGTLLLARALIVLRN